MGAGDDLWDTVIAVVDDGYKGYHYMTWLISFRLTCGSFCVGGCDLPVWYWLPFCNNMTSCPSVRPCGNCDGA